MPVEHVTVGPLPVMTPIDFAPELCHRAPYLTLCGGITVEILASREQGLNHEGGFDEIAAIVIFAEKGDRSTRIAVEKMRPHTVESVRTREEAHDLQHALCNLLAWHEASFRRNEHRHDSEAAASEREQIRIARQ